LRNVASPTRSFTSEHVRDERLWKGKVVDGDKCASLIPKAGDLLSKTVSREERGLDLVSIHGDFSCSPAGVKFWRAFRNHIGRVRTCRDAQSHDGRLVGGFNDVGMEIDKCWIEVAPDDGFQTQNGFVEVPRSDAGQATGSPFSSDMPYRMTPPEVLANAETSARSSISSFEDGRVCL
jgi:hypothetical protein